MKSTINKLKNSSKVNSFKILILSSFSAFTLLASCAGSKAVVDNEVQMRGDWTISDVSVSGINESYVNITVLDEAKTECYERSSWHLVQNNASGNYTLNGGNGCPSSTSKIKWFVTDENGQMFFNFKRIYEGERPKNVVDGYKMRIISNTGSSMVLTQDLMFEGKPISVNYTFQKN